MFSIPMNLEKSIKINKSAQEIFHYISDFSNWSKWSPWLVQEPNCKTKVEGASGTVGHKQEWDGSFIGSGSMQIVSFNKPTEIQLELQFLKPWKSQSKVYFLLEEIQGQTTLKWGMKGSLPFFMFFFKDMMIALVGNDYDRGLMMLKDCLETGAVHTKVEVPGVQTKKGFSYVGIHRECSLNDVGPLMQKDFEVLMNWKKNNNIMNEQFALSFYHKYDFVKNICEYTCGFGFSELPKAKLEPNMVTGQVNDHQALQVNHLGPYKFLGNAWSTAMSRQRALKLKAQKSIPWYEVYKTMPGMVPESQYNTEINIPVRKN